MKAKPAVFLLLHNVRSEQNVGAIFRIADLRKPALALIGIEIARGHVAYVRLGHRLVLMKGDFNDFPRNEVPQLGLVNRLPLLHAENVCG